MQATLLVMLGGAIGAAARYQLGRFAFGAFGPGYPWGTLAANLIGGLAMGALVGVAARNEPMRLLLGVGLLGGFTTFSAFSLEAAQMIQRGELMVAAAYAVSSVAGSVMLLFIGFWLARATA